jgi:hypothetical protein
VTPRQFIVDSFHVLPSGLNHTLGIRHIRPRLIIAVFPMFNHENRLNHLSNGDPVPPRNAGKTLS